MFIDRARIYVQAGSGGNGCRSFFRDKSGRIVRPEGGDGGKGGDVIIRADANVQTLLDFHYRRHFRAERGAHGSGNQRKGRDGAGKTILVPPGTMVYDESTGCMLRDLDQAGTEFIVCRGGRGGRGNNRRHDAEEGVPGEEKTLRIELKLLAEVGIIGCPNAGKSTLIARISSARPKIAQYPFTTTSPVLGVVKGKFRDFVAADIPGLIEGAHEGRGLGDQFLRHVERTSLLIHLVDMSPEEGRDPVADYQSLIKNLQLYGKGLIDKPQIMVASKMDITGAEERLADFRRKIKSRIYPISALTGRGLAELMAAVEKKLLPKREE